MTHTPKFHALVFVGLSYGLVSSFGAAGSEAWARIGGGYEQLRLNGASFDGMTFKSDVSFVVPFAGVRYGIGGGLAGHYLLNSSNGSSASLSGLAIVLGVGLEAPFLAGTALLSRVASEWEIWSRYNWENRRMSRRVTVESASRLPWYAGIRFEPVSHIWVALEVGLVQGSFSFAGGTATEGLGYEVLAHAYYPLPL